MPNHHHVSHLLDRKHVGDSWLDRVDPRLRIVTAVVSAITIASLHRMPAMGFALAVALLGVAAAQIPVNTLYRRLLPLEVVLAILLLLMPWTASSVDPLAIAISHQGLTLGIAIALKANAIMLCLLALVGNMDVLVFGHALAHLRIPQKLAHLLLFTVRYLDVLHREYRRLRAAMKVRCFRPRMNGHTYRAYGYLVGMLLVRSFDRSERILSAMKCRGFRGCFYLLEHFAYSPRRDIPFCGAAVGALAVLLFLEWT